MDANAAAGAGLGVRADPRRWYALVLLCAAFSMVILDSTIVYVALPSIQQALGFSAVGVQWVVTVYLLTFAGLLLGGRTADLAGARCSWRGGAVRPGLAGLRAGLVGRGAAGGQGAQGVAAAMLTPAALALLVTSFAEGAERNRFPDSWCRRRPARTSSGLLARPATGPEERR